GRPAAGAAGRAHIAGGNGRHRAARTVVLTPRPSDAASVHSAMAAGKAPTALRRPYRRLRPPTPVGRSVQRRGRRTWPPCPPHWRPGRRRPPYDVVHATPIHPTRRAVKATPWPPDIASVHSAMAAGKAPTALRRRTRDSDPPHP